MFNQFCYKALVTKQLQTKDPAEVIHNFEKPWDSVTTTAPFTFHLRKPEEETQKNLTEVGSNAPADDLGMLTFQRLCSSSVKLE